MQKRMHSREFKLEVMRQIASGSSPGQARSWHSLDEIACRHVRRSVAFSPHLIRPQLRPREPSFSKICSLAPREKGASRRTVGPTGAHFLIFNIDGTREAARQRALPNIQDRPASKRRLRPLCAPRLPLGVEREKSCAPAPQSYRLHHQLACLPCVREHRCIGRPSFLPLGVQFICPPQVDIEMLNLRRRNVVKRPTMHSLADKMPCLLVEGECIAYANTCMASSPAAIHQ